MIIRVLEHNKDGSEAELEKTLRPLALSSYYRFIDRF